MSENSTIPARARLANLAGQHFGGDRDLYEVFGYPRHLDPADYADTYLRGDLAARIVDAYPDATWREAPELEGAPDFQKSWEEIANRLKIWRAFHRLDRLTGLGHYGVLLLGLDGGEPMHTPATRSDYGLMYIQPHSERTAEVTTWEDDVSSPRFGMPKLYRVTAGVNWTGAGASRRTLTVHHSRVIHVAEKALEDVAIGVPRLQRVWNRYMDLEKLLGGGAEIYWQNAAMMMAFIAQANVDWEPEEKSEMADQLEEMQHGLRRFLRLRGVEAENLAPGLQGADPSPFIDKTLDAIAGATGIPKRILIGSERGELSSEQDENNWAGRIAERREQFATPEVIEPFIARGQKLGFLARGFESVEWPESDTLGEQARAEIASSKATALREYLSVPGAETVVPPDEFRAWLGEEPLRQEDVEGIDPLDESDPEVRAQWGRRSAANG